MEIYDITQELFGGNVYPGDEAPSYRRVLDMEKGDLCNLSVLTMCAHNATHLDAPKHFYKDGKPMEQLDLARCIGPCSVIDLWSDSLDILEDRLKTSQKRLLLKGKVTVTLEMAKLFNRYQIELVGVESQSVGPLDAPMPVHLELLKTEVVLLEGLVLANVKADDYFLFAAPLKLGGCEGAPCRAVLLKFDE
ncbi:MAG: cyclase family protein [Herbinix sp.]|jgi:arylformamidase|nr:cyclase family protein [Herbinix sp.]